MYQSEHDQKHVQSKNILKIMHELQIRQFETDSPCQSEMHTTMLTFWVVVTVYF